MCINRSSVLKGAGKFIAILFLAVIPRIVAYGAATEEWYAPGGVHGAETHESIHRYSHAGGAWGLMENHDYGRQPNEKDVWGKDWKESHESMISAHTQVRESGSGNTLPSLDVKHSGSKHGQWSHSHGAAWYYRGRS